LQKKQRYITADIQIPESVWQSKSKNKIRDYLALKIREVIELFVARLKKDKLEINEQLLLIEIDQDISEFKKIDYEISS